MQNGEICLSFSALFWIRRCSLVDGEWPGVSLNQGWRNDGGGSYPQDPCMVYVPTFHG